MKAGQQGRDRCNQIPRGRHQHTGVQAGPEHKKTTRGAGEAGRTETGTTTKEGRQHGKHQDPHKHSEERKNQERRRARRSTKTAQSHEPHRATHAKKHRTDKEKEDSTDKAVERQIAQDLSKAR